MEKKILIKAKALLNDVTPLKGDCGEYCDRACCKDNGDAGSCVWLLPNEDESAMRAWAEVNDAIMPQTQTRVRAIYCKSPCEREARPFMCRIFPLSPYYSQKQGKWSVRMDRRSAALCPLYKYGKAGLSREFVCAAQAAVELLGSDSEYEAFLKKLESEESAYRFEL